MDTIIERREAYRPSRHKPKGIQIPRFSILYPAAGPAELEDVPVCDLRDHGNPTR